MSIPGAANPLLLAQLDTGYKITRSLRFNSSDSAYCSRVPSTAGNRKTWTWSGWVKRAGLGTFQTLLHSGADSENATQLRFNSADTIKFEHQDASVETGTLVTSQVFRDVSAWYHIVLACDTTQATDTNRLKLYVNGTQVTTFSSSTYPSQNADLDINTTTSHRMGGSILSTNYLSGYLADIHFIDGQALTPSSFAETNATTGQWVPKAYSGSYGTNGFQLKFADNSAATATTLGKDTSGNSNNWTPNNLSVTAGAGNDSLVDTPTSYGTDTGAGGEVRGNYATLNPLAKGANVTLSDGNLQTAITGESGPHAIATVGMDYGGNNFYCEFTQTVAGSNLNMVGLVKAGVSLTTNYVGADANSWGYFGNGNKYTNGSASSYGSSWGANDVIGIAYKGSTGELFFYKNGVAQNSGNAAFSSLTNGPYFFAVGNGLGGTGVINFGQRQWAYAPPAGFKTLCDTNLPAPVVAKPNTVMDVATYTGDNTNNRTITTSNSSLKSGLVWIKSRSAAYNHILFDSLRGTGNYLATNSTGAENFAGSLSWTNSGPTGSNSFKVDYGTNPTLNELNSTYVGWVFDAGSSTVTNTQGSITSQVRANASAGFSVVTFTTDGTTKTVGHGLNVKPSLVIVKSRNVAGSWLAITDVLGSMQYGVLNSTAAFASIGYSAPTSTVFQYNDNNGNTQVAYCFAPVAGYSSFGSYVGNGSTDGPFVFCNFRPAFVLVKGTSTGYIWTIEDSKRDTYNGTSKYLQPQSSDAEGSVSAPHYDFTSNGFKIRTTDSAWNQNGITYIYFAVAESPFAYSRAR